jgi:hypothetical protein
LWCRRTWRKVRRGTTLPVLLVALACLASSGIELSGQKSSDVITDWDSALADYFDAFLANRARSQVAYHIFFWQSESDALIPAELPPRFIWMQNWPAAVKK